MSANTIVSAPDRAGARLESRTRPRSLAHPPAPVYALSLLVALLLLIAAGAGLLWPATVYPTDELRRAFLPVDLFHLLVGLPLLLGSIWLARRGRLAGVLCWPGALLYLLYSYLTNLLGVPFGPLFLPYLLLVTVSAYTTIALVAHVDGEGVRRRLGTAVPVRVTALLLAGLSALFAVVNTGAIVGALASHPPALPEHPLFVLIADFTTVIPLCLVGGLLLWRRQPLGYVAGAGLLLFYTLLLLGLLPVLFYPAVSEGAPVPWTDAGLMAGLGFLSLALLTRWLRAAQLSERGTSVVDETKALILKTLPQVDPADR